MRCMGAHGAQPWKVPGSTVRIRPGGGIGDVSLSGYLTTTDVPEGTM